MEYKVSKKYNDIFVKRAKEVADILGISSSWEIEFKFEELEEDTNAQVYCDVQARRAVITNNMYRNETPTAKMMRDDGGHEPLHILLAPLTELAEERYVASEKNIESEVHAVIQTLMKLI